MMHKLGKCSMRKRSQPEEYIFFCGIASYIIKSLQMYELTNNHVYKLTTEKLQPVY